MRIVPLTHHSRKHRTTPQEGRRAGDKGEGTGHGLVGWVKEVEGGVTKGVVLGFMARWRRGEYRG